MVGAGRDTLTGGEGGDCFFIEIPESFPAATTVEPKVSSDPDDAKRKAVIRGTKDTILDYEAGDSIVIGGNAAGGTPTVYGTDTSKEVSIAVKSVIIRPGAIHVVTQAYRMGVQDDSNTPDNDETVRAVSQQTEILVTVPGLPGINAEVEKVTIGGQC